MRCSEEMKFEVFLSRRGSRAMVAIRDSLAGDYFGGIKLLLSMQEWQRAHPTLASRRWAPGSSPRAQNALVAPGQMHADAGEARGSEGEGRGSADLDGAVEKVFARSVNLNVASEVARAVGVEAEVADEQILVRIVVILASAIAGL